MNAPIQITEGTPLLDFDAACRRLNLWRGQMVENFARSEQAATEALVALNAVDAEVKGVKFPHLVGQRYERLVKLLSSGSQTGHRKAALAAIERFRTHDVMRTMLCHGVTKVAVDRGGEWVALMSMLTFKGGGPDTAKLTLLESDATRLLERVIEDRRRVSAALGQVRRESASPR